MHAVANQVLSKDPEARVVYVTASEFMIDMINSIIKLSNHPTLEPIILNEAKNEIQNQYLSSEKAGRVLGWEPQYQLEEGLTETMAWYQKFLTIS